MLQRPSGLKITAYFEMPKSWSKKKRSAMAGDRHRVKPDADNVAKCVMDALWDDDSCISELTVIKCWAGEMSGPRVQVEILP
jgi:Holliday junction resolvase RusA-like endonuclease